MASLVDIFNPSFFMFLGILVLVAALLVVYFESKMREQNHKMASMLNLITCMADEMNAIKLHLNHQTTNFSVGGSTFQPSSLETNDVHIVKTDLIHVSDDSDSDSDNDSENSIEDNDSDSGSESNSEDIDEVKNIIEIGDNNDIKDHIDIKVLKLNLSNINDIDENKDVNDFEDLEDIQEEDTLSLDSVSVSSNEEFDEIKNDNENDNDNDDELDISKLNLKSINISSLEEIKDSDNIDYKKFTLSKLRSTVIEKGIVVDSSKLKKNELLKLLGAE